MADTKPLEAPHVRHEREQREREARLDHVQDWLDGRVKDPALEAAATPGRFEMEVGERVERTPGELREGPGLTVIAPEDDGMSEHHNGWTVLRPGVRKASLKEYQRRP